MNFEPLRTNVRATLARAYVRTFAASREPRWLLTETFLAIIGMFAYVYIYRGMGAPREYESFAVIGGVMMSYWLAVLWTMGTQLHWEKQGGTLALYMIAPCSRLAILTGMALGGIVMTSVRALSALAIGLWIFHVPFHPSHPVQLIAVFVLTLVALYALGMCFASLFLLYGREIWQLAHALQEPVFLGSGVYFPLRALGPWAAAAVSALPLAMGLDAMRQFIFPPEVARGLLPIRTEIAILAVCLVVFITSAVYALRWVETIAKREGTLITRHQ
jgi:ABC-2 type transport system permease protein